MAAGDTHGDARPITAAEWLACDLVSLREAVAGLALSVPGIEAFAAAALDFAERNAARLRELLTRLPELTVDQIAAINLYTKQNTSVPDHSLFKLLNQALNGRERARLAPFFPYLRLVSAAQDNLPNAGPCDGQHDRL